MLLNYKKIVLMSHRLAAFHSQCQWTHTCLSLTTPMAMETQLGFKRRHRVQNSKILIQHQCWSSIIFTCHPFPTLAHIIGKRTFQRHRKCRYSSERPEKL